MPHLFIIDKYINLSLFFELSDTDSTGSYGNTTKAFIFSLRNKIRGAFKSLVKSRSQAIYRSSRSGPVFGGGHDIIIFDQANSNDHSYTNFGHSYSVPLGIDTGDRHLKILAGSYHFKPDDWEVFFLV